MWQYLSRFLDKTDPSASLKHAAYAVVILCACGWLSVDMTIKTFSGDTHTHRGIDANWVAAFGLLLGAVTVGKVVGSGQSPAPTAGAVGDTTIIEKDRRS